MHFHAAVCELAGEGDYFCDYEFGDGAGVGKGRVEDADSARGGVGKVDLVGADAEAADDEELFCGSEDAGGELGFGADADDVDIPGGSFCVS